MRAGILARLGGQSRLALNSGTTIIVDGNSNYAGWAGLTIAARLQQAMPEAASVSIVTDAVSGHTWRKMNGLDGGTRAALDTAISTAPTTERVLLIAGEGTNSAGADRTSADMVADAKSYFDAARAIRPSRVRCLYVGATPRSPSSASASTWNAAIRGADAIASASPASVGADWVVLPSVLEAYAHEGTNVADYEAHAGFWGDAPSYIHWSASGATAIAGLIAAKIRRLPNW